MKFKYPIPLNLLLIIFVGVAVIFLPGCSTTKNSSVKKPPSNPGSSGVVELKYTARSSKVPPRRIDTKNVQADDLVSFAKTLVGTRYTYGSSDKEKGFDCSGFINYVFNHFNIQVPRSSVEFTNAGRTVEPVNCRLGDLILFTGTDTTGWVVGHMGIITQNKQGDIRFIHAASGNNKGVMISGMSQYFITRFVKVVRVLN